MPLFADPIIVAARESPLSKAQLQEVYEEIRALYPEVQFVPHFVKTRGDRDKRTSLRLLEKTDFFTYEIDQLLLERKCDIAVHSAKDLPDPLPKGLFLAALTRGVDSGDVIVLREGHSLESLPLGAVIGTSSFRREEMVRALRSDLVFADIRGTIEERLELLFSNKVDGVVMAEAALIRLHLTYLNRIRLEGDTVLHQGRLAVVTHEDNEKMRLLFQPLHAS